MFVSMYVSIHIEVHTYENMGQYSVQCRCVWRYRGSIFLQHLPAWSIETNLWTMRFLGWSQLTLRQINAAAMLSMLSCCWVHFWNMTRRKHWNIGEESTVLVLFIETSEAWWKYRDSIEKMVPIVFMMCHLRSVCSYYYSPPQFHPAAALAGKMTMIYCLFFPINSWQFNRWTFRSSTAPV